MSKLTTLAAAVGLLLMVCPNADAAGGGAGGGTGGAMGGVQVWQTPQNEPGAQERHPPMQSYGSMRNDHPRTRHHHRHHHET